MPYLVLLYYLHYCSILLQYLHFTAGKMCFADTKYSGFEELSVLLFA